jgi:hypothetical protein
MNWFLGKRLLGPGFRCVLVANDSDKAELRHASEHLGSNIRTARVVAKIFSKQFFAPVRSRVPRLDRYLRNGESPNRILVLSDGQRPLAQVAFYSPDEVPPTPEEVGELTLRQRRIQRCEIPGGGG